MRILGDHGVFGEGTKGCPQRLLRRVLSMRKIDAGVFYGA